VNDPLYAKDVLRLAAAATGAGRLAAFDAQGSARNPVCGDRVSVTLTVDERGRVDLLAHETHACVLAQASAAILGAHLKGAGKAEIGRLREEVAAMLNGAETPPPPFADYGVLRGAAVHRNRHACVLLPIDAVIAALEPAEG
jgi:NifU-like protein involved in Fe-S cluster formation